MTKCEKFAAYEYNKAPIKEKLTEKQDVKKYGYGVRHIQLILFTLCLIFNFIARGHMGVTIVAMTCKEESLCLNISVNIRSINESDDIVDPNNLMKSILSSKEADNRLEGFTVENRHKTYNWSTSTQEIVLGSFFLGYTIMMFPVGIICQERGGKLPLQISLLVNGIVSIITPWLTFWGGWKAISFCRFLQGLAQAGTYPCIQALLAKWVPICERGTLISYVYTGSSLGNIVACQMGGFLGASRYGWPSTFWVVGVVCLFGFVALTVFGAATPTEHKTISLEEKQFILGRTIEYIRRPKTPWKAMLKSKPMWGTIATHVGSGITYTFFFIQVPSYIHNVLGVSVRNSGVLSSLPYIASLFSSLAFGWISDYCTNNNLVSIKNARKISNSFSQFGIGISLMCVSFTDNTAIAVACLVVAMVCHMAIHTGWMVNHMDLAPNFSGIMMAIGNTLLNIFNILLTFLVAIVITDMKNVTEWRIMFFIVAGICLVTNAIFILLMSSEEQPWNDPEFNETFAEGVKLESIEKEKKNTDK